MAQETTPVTTLPAWTNNRFIVAVILALASAFASVLATLALTYWVFNTRLGNLEHEIKTKADSSHLNTLEGELKTKADITRLNTLEVDLKAKADITRLSTLEGDLKTLSERTSKFDDLRVAQEKTDTDISTLLQKANDHVVEITTLRNKVNQLEVDAARHVQALNDAAPTITGSRNKIDQLEIDAARWFQAISDGLRRISSLEADLKATNASIPRQPKGRPTEAA